MILLQATLSTIYGNGFFGPEMYGMPGSMYIWTYLALMLTTGLTVSLVIKRFNLKNQLLQEAADAVLLTSGTTALEAMLLKKPMVVGYRMNPLSFKLLFPLIKTAYVSLPNLLANQSLVPELIQDEATVESLSAEVVNLFKANSSGLVEQFDELHQQLSLDSATLATAAISKLLASE